MRTEDVGLLTLVLLSFPFFFSTCVFTPLYVERVESDLFQALRTAEDSGYSQVDLYDQGDFLGTWEGCSDESIYYKMRATNAANRRVDLLICCGGITKTCTIRHR